MQHAPSPPPPRTRLRLARRPHRTVRSTLRTQLIARRLLITRAHTQPCATRHARNTMRAIRTHTMRSPSAAHSARQAPRPGSHANAAGMPAARLPPSRPRRPHASAAGMPAAPRLPPSPGTPPHRPLASATGGGSTSDPVLAQARKRPRTTKLGTSRLSLSERPLQGRPHYHTEEMSERSGTHTHRATASFHPRLDRGPLSALSGAWSGTVALPNRSPGPGKPGGGVTNFALIAGRVTQRTPQPAVRLRLGRGGLQRDTAAAAPTRCARRSLRSVLAFQHLPRTRPAHTAPPQRSARRRIYRQCHRPPPARQRRTAHSPGRAAPPELADSSTPTSAHTQAPHASPRTRAPNTTTLAAATVRYARSVPRRAHTHLTIDIA